MAGQKPSPDQQAIIDNKTENILVPAAAGSGKTTVMIERIITKIIEDIKDDSIPDNEKHSLDSILVVTFTIAAAEHMREKAEDALNKAIADSRDNPELVAKLVLGVTLSRNNETVVKVVNHWIEQFEQGKHTEFVEDMLRNMYSEAYIRKYSFLFPILIRFSVPKNMERFMRLAKACMTCDTYDRLKEIKCPVLVLGGSKDLVTTGQASVEMAEKLGCEIYMYENLGHSAYEEAADFNDRIYDFFKA